MGYNKIYISKRLKSIVWDYRIGNYIGLMSCPCCGENEIVQSDFDCGHIKAESKSGSLSKDNLIPICHQCNMSMHNMHMKVFMMQQFNRRLSKILKEYKNTKKRLTNIIKGFMSKRSKRTKLDICKSNL